MLAVEDARAAEAHLPEPLRRFRERLRGLIAWRERLRAAAVPLDGRWREWRERQLARSYGELGKGWMHGTVFCPAALELSKGCSGGCWFCGVGAERLTAVLPHTPENAALFKGALEALAAVAGRDALTTAFLYWATDPFDNPHYEAFCNDFWEVAGCYPGTTTALALRDPERTRAWLREAPRRGLPLTRFSVLSVRMLDRLHATFSAEEMAGAECVLLTPESRVAKANAGRFRERAARDPSLLDREVEKLPLEGVAPELARATVPSTIACVTGFLMNLVERKIRLATPCRASAQFPLGYATIDEARLDDSAGVRAVLERMIAERMTISVPRSLRLGFRADLRLTVSQAGANLWNCNGALRFPSARGEFLVALAQLLQERRHTRDEIAHSLLARYGVFPAETKRLLGDLYRRGLLDEWPSARDVACREATAEIPR